MKKPLLPPTLMLMLLLMLAAPLRAQDQLTGRVTDVETGLPLEAVMVTVLRDSLTVDYALTDHEGRYTLSWRRRGTLQVSASYLGYARQTVDVDRAGRLDFALRPTSIALRQVTIRPGRVSARRDTVRYNLADFATAKDTKIRDVLKRLPGIDVEENGTVTYQGKAIDHFLVEGMDITGGRYNQVNANLDARAVKTAELMENYQSVSALRGKINSEQVALNLRLDERARDQWFPTLDLGGGLTEEADGGAAPLWDASFSALQLGPNRQSLFAAKSNNTGRDLSNEQTILAQGSVEAITLPTLLAQSDLTRPLDTRRILFNETYTGNANRMYRRSDTRTLRLQAAYTHDEIRQQRGDVQHFYTPTDTVSLSEESDYHLRTDAAHLDLAYEDNASTHYLSDRLHLEAEHARGLSPQLHQTKETTGLRLRHRLHYLKSRDRHTWEATSDVQWSYLPSTLTLSAGADDYRQHSLYTRHSLSYLRKHNGLTRQLKGSLLGEWSRFRLPDIIYSTRTYYVYNASRIGAEAEPSLQWDRGRWMASVSVPVGWVHYFGARRSYFRYRPSLYVRYRPDYHWTWSLLGQVHRDGGSSLDLCPLPRRTDYRTLMYTYGLMPSPLTFTGQAYAEYKNTVQEFFATVTLFYQHARHHTLDEQYVSADTLALIRHELTHSSDYGSMSATLSKGFYDWHLKFSLELSLSRYQGRQLTGTASGRTLQNYRYDAFRAEPKIIWSPVSWLEATYHANISHSATRIDHSTHLKPLTDVVQRFRLSLTAGRVDFVLSGEHYRNALGDGTHLTLLLADASAVWRYDRWRVEASLCNLFNKQHYAYTTYTATQSRTDWLRIRPRELFVKIGYQF